MDIKDLTPEQQEKVEACESVEELMELAEAEGIELSEEDLDGIAGGRIRNWRVRTYQPRVIKKNQPQSQPGSQSNPNPEPSIADAASDAQ